jgi:hypothetical protein
MSHETTSSSSEEATNPMDKLLAKLSEQQDALAKQRELLKSSEEPAAYDRTLEYVSGASIPAIVAPAVDGFNISTVPTEEPARLAGDSPSQLPDDEVLRLKLELEAAKGRIARMDQELAQTRITKHTLDQVIGSPSELDFPVGQQAEGSGHRFIQQDFKPNVRSQAHRDLSWAAQDDSRSDTSDALSASGFNRARAIWANGPKPAFPGTQAPATNFQPSEAVAATQWMNRGFGQTFVDAPMQYTDAPISTFRSDRIMLDSDVLMAPPAGRRNNPGGRFTNRAVGSFSYAGSSGSYDGFTPVTAQYGPANGMGGGVGASMGMRVPAGMSTGMYSGYQPQPIGTPLSPHAPEFTSSTGWKSDVSTAQCTPFWTLLMMVQSVTAEGQTYLPTTEPLNYRRLLDRTVNCDWRYIVEKIVCNNDQQASIFLQQKLKVGTTEQKYDIVEAIVGNAYALMVNRFGNFLVQRCFEHGTPEQVIKIAEAIRGRTLDLSMDAFGCHVVQKAFDSVPEDYKAIMVHELLRRIPETVIHRYACHVWQKLFELRWTESPPQIMKYVNEALRGMWHEVALGETGSLVVQNIFENCLEEDKVCNSNQFFVDGAGTNISPAPLHRRGAC